MQIFMKQKPLQIFGLVEQFHCIDWLTWTGLLALLIKLKEATYKSGAIHLTICQKHMSIHIPDTGSYVGHTYENKLITHRYLRVKTYKTGCYKNARFISSLGGKTSKSWGNSVLEIILIKSYHASCFVFYFWVNLIGLTPKQVFLYQITSCAG